LSAARAIAAEVRGIVRERFLAHHAFAGGDGRQGDGLVGRRDRADTDQVNLRIVDHGPVVAADLGVVPRADRLGGLRPDVADVDDLGARLLKTLVVELGDVPAADNANSRHVVLSSRLTLDSVVQSSSTG